MKKHDAKQLLVKRVYSGLKNLSEMMVRGEQLLEERAAAHEYLDEVEEAIEWVDGEEDYLIDDDVDLVEDQILWVPSKAWEERNMARLDDARLHVEREEAAHWQDFADTEGGLFNRMDGRYHSHAAHFTEKMTNDHYYRTENRKVCTYYFGKKGCKYDYNCTRRHSRTDDEWKFITDLRKNKVPRRERDYTTPEEEEMYAHFGGGGKRKRTQ